MGIRTIVQQKTVGIRKIMEGIVTYFARHLMVFSIAAGGSFFAWMTLYPIVIRLIFGIRIEDYQVLDRLIYIPVVVVYMILYACVMYKNLRLWAEGLRNRS